MTEPATATPPTSLFRVGRRRGLLNFSVIDPVDAALQAGNRFDVPGGGVLYAGSDSEGCFAETLSRFRPTPRIRDLVKGEKGFMVAGGVPQDWRLKRALAQLRVVDPLPFLDVEDPQTHEHLSEALAPQLYALGYENPLDISDVRGRDRQLSRLIASYAYSATETDGSASFSGLRYLSRLGSEWECWAIFRGTVVELVDQTPIELHEPALQRVADRWGLRIF